MKKIIFIALFSAAILMSCVKDEKVTPGADIPNPVDYTPLVLNEINGSPAVDTDKYIELYNNGIEAINLLGVELTYNGVVTWTGNASQSIAAGGYFVVLGTKKSVNPTSMMSEGLSAGKNIKVQLLDPSATVIQSFQRGDGLGGNVVPGETITSDYSRVPNATGVFYFTDTAGTKGVTNGTVTAGLTPVDTTI